MKCTLIKVAPSKIQGHGVFALRSIPRGTIIYEDVWRSGFNHSCDPNVVLILENGWVVKKKTIRPIAKGEELTVHYNRRHGRTIPKDCIPCNCPVHRKMK